MENKMDKRLVTIAVLLILAFTGLAAQTRTRTIPMTFDNPGNRRILQNEDGNYFYFRSLPERSMTLNVKDISEITLRSFAIEPLRKPQVIIIINKKRSTYDLSLASRLNGYYLYNPLTISIPKGTETIEVLCYERSIYLRSFYTVVHTPKPKVVRIPNLQIKEHAGIMQMQHNDTSSEYHSFNREQPLVFELNNSRNAVVYVRARLADRSLPVFELYKDGELVDTYEFTLKRTTRYKVSGIRHLSIGMKIELPPNSGSSRYELRAASDHLYLGRPVLLKRQ